MVFCLNSFLFLFIFIDKFFKELLDNEKILLLLEIFYIIAIIRINEYKWSFRFTFI